MDMDIRGDAHAQDMVNRETVAACPVNSHNEFDPLKEVIVGCVGDATIPEWHVSGKAVWPSKHWDFFKNKAGQSFPPELMVKAGEELDNFQRILEAEGVTVRRPGMCPLPPSRSIPPVASITIVVSSLSSTSSLLTRPSPLIFAYQHTPSLSLTHTHTQTREREISPRPSAPQISTPRAVCTQPCPGIYYPCSGTRS
jgi:hypothetical protein